jgi:hypothetical protein
MRKMDSRFLMAGMTNADGCPMKDVGHEEGRRVGDNRGTCEGNSPQRAAFVLYCPYGFSS